MSDKQIIHGPPMVASPGDGGGDAAVLRERAAALRAAAETLTDAAAGLARIAQDEPGDDAEGIEFAIEYLNGLAALRRRMADAASPS